MGEADAVGLRDEPVERAVAVETPRSTLRHDFETRFVVAIEHLLRNLSRWGAVDQRERICSVPLDVDDCYRRRRVNAPDGCTRL